MKPFEKISVLLVLAILAGLFGFTMPAEVVAQDPGPKMSVFELSSSHT